MSKAILLNTGWTFTKEGHDEPVTLPHTWNAVDGQDGGNDYYRGTCSYTRKLEKPELSDGDRAVLQFDGVAMTAVVSLNGRAHACSHTGRYRQNYATAPAKQRAAAGRCFRSGGLAGCCNGFVQPGT